MKRFLLISFILLVAASMIFASGGSQSQGSVPIQNASTITVEVFDRGTDGGRSDPTNNNWTDWIKQKVLKDENINVSFVSIPRSQEEQGIINKMAAGDAPDIIFTYNAILVNNFALQGGLFEMTPYVDSLMPDLRSFLGPDPSVPGRDFIYRMTDSSTGKLYAVPATRMPIPLGLGEMGSFIRKDWLDKLGLPEPTTTQQFYDTMVAFRDKDPGNVGKGVVIPYAMRTYDMMLGAFLDPNLSDKDRWIEGDYVQPGYKEMIRFLNKMYNEGLIDKDFPLYNDFGEHAFALLISGVAGCYGADRDHPYRESPGIIANLQKTVPDGWFTPINPFTNSLGKTPKVIYDPVGLYMMVPIFSKAPQTALRYLNWVSKFENRSFLQLGPEGIVHNMVNGIPQLIPATGLWIQDSPQNIDYTLTINGLDLGDPVKNVQAIVNGYKAEYAADVIKAHEYAVKDGKALPVVPVTLTVTQYNTVLNDKIIALRANAISSSPAQFDKIWDDGIKDYLASGGQAVIDERRAKYIAP